MKFIKIFNWLNVVGYFLYGIIFAGLGFNMIIASYPRVFNEVPYVYYLLIILELSVFLIPLALCLIIFYQMKLNVDFFQYDQIGPEYILIKGSNQKMILSAFFIVIILVHIIIQLILENFLNHYLYSSRDITWYTTYTFELVIIILTFFLPYLLVLYYNIVIINLKGSIDKKHLGFVVNILITIIALMIFILIIATGIYYVIEVYASYFGL